MSGALQAVFQNQRGFAIIPGVPTVGTATQTGMTTATVTFTQPASNGGAAITQYRAISTPASITGTLNQAGSGTITVSGLTASTNYTFTVRATNSVGNSAESSASNQITTSANPGSESFTTAGTFSWVAPAGVTKVSLLAVGNGTTGGNGNGCESGAGGRGGDLRYVNNSSVTPGVSYTVFIAAPGGLSNYFGACVVKAGAGSGTVGTGFNGYNPPGPGQGGGGAGGYSGDGASGTGGSGGRGSTTSAAVQSPGGGGVGIFGQGSSGANGTGSAGGGGGSCGTAGSAVGALGVGADGGLGGARGGGGGGGGRCGAGAAGGVGAIRIIWPGDTRSFPSTSAGSP